MSENVGNKNGYHILYSTLPCRRKYEIITKIYAFSFFVFRYDFCTRLAVCITLIYQSKHLDGFIIKTHVRGFFDTDLHEVSWHFATHEAVRPSGF